MFWTWEEDTSELEKMGKYLVLYQMKDTTVCISFVHQLATYGESQTH